MRTDSQAAGTPQIVLRSDWPQDHAKRNDRVLPDVKTKIARLRAGAPPRLLDLFAGCGGLSLGFHASGFNVVAAVDSDPAAARSHGANFHNGADQHCLARDVLTAPASLARDLGLAAPPGAFDVVVGGPPCQAFARVGRPKLREIVAHPQAFLHDPRARLFLEWLHYVDVCQPLAVLMENVPDVMNHGGQNIAEETCEVLQRMGYVCAYTLLNASFYGVPQMRERMFLIGYRREVASHVQFPEPTHSLELPPGYQGSRSVALKSLRESHCFGSGHSYVPPPEPQDALPPGVTAREAIGDLPTINALAQFRSGELRRGARRFDKPLTYRPRQPLSSFAKLMRTWPEFEGRESLYDHVIRYQPRDFELFARMNPGDQYPEAHRHACEMFSERLEIERLSGKPVPVGSPQYDRLRREIVPPYDVGEFPNKWRKMWPDKPARTLMAHLGKDGYSHIHYDSIQARTVSVREAARLQSFPRWLQVLRYHESGIPPDRKRRSATAGQGSRRGNNADPSANPMINKLAVKRLTASDLTFFEWHFRNAPAGNQKAINLNADVFSDQLYPSLDNIVRKRQYKLGIDLWIAGPAAAQPVNLQRKIIKGASYKNWRLDGEIVHNPEDQPDRFNVLVPGDIALLGLEGDLFPDTVSLVLLVANSGRTSISPHHWTGFSVRNEWQHCIPRL